MIRVAWKKPQPTPQQGKRKKVLVSAAIVKGQGDRFLLYQTAKGRIPSMWTLWDQTKSVQHFLYGDDLKQAKHNAVERIRKVLTTE